MAASSYGTYPAAAIEPFPIETQLAGLAAGGSPGRAQQLLSLYQTERNTAENQYYDLMQQQRGFAYANLHQQMVDRAVKTMADAAQHPEMAPYLQGFQYGREAMGPGDPNAANQLFTNLNTAASLGRAKTAAEVIQAGAAGGGMPDLGQLSGSTGLQFNPSVPTSVAAAAARAAGQQRQGPHMMVPVPSGEVDSEGKPQYVQVPVPVDATPEEVQAIIQQAKRNMGQVNQGQPNIPGGPPDPRAKGTTNLPPANAKGDMNPATNPLLGPLPGYGPNGLPLAQTDTPANAPATPAPAPTGGGAQAAPIQPPTTNAARPDTPTGKIESWSTPDGITLQNRARQGLSTLSETARQNVLGVAGKIGGVMPIRIINGTPQYIGKDGNPVGPVP